MTEKEIAEIESRLNYHEEIDSVTMWLFNSELRLLITALRSDRAKLKAETEALELAAGFISEKLPGDCPVNYGDPEICPSWCNHNECLQPSHLKVRQCYESHFRGEK